MNYELTIFRNQFDNKTHRRLSFETWDSFVNWLYKISQVKGQKGGNNSSPLISPAVFEDGSTRSNRSTSYWGSWCAVDVDDHDFPVLVDDLKGALISNLIIMISWFIALLLLAALIRNSVSFLERTKRL